MSPHLVLWDVAGGFTTVVLEGHRKTVVCCALSDDGRLAASGSLDGVRVWDATTGNELARLEGHAGGVTSVAFTPGGTGVVTTGNDGVLRVWRLEGGEGAGVG